VVVIVLYIKKIVGIEQLNDKFFILFKEYSLRYYTQTIIHFLDSLYSTYL
jgi:hypothetical protein